MEAQSYPLEAIQMRTMFYLAETYQAYLSENDIDLYDINPDNTPEWEMYAVFTGGKNRGIKKLRALQNDLFDPSSFEQITGDEGPLRHYIEACHVIDTVIAENHDEKPEIILEKIIDGCGGRCGKIGEYVRSRRFEIMGIYAQMFDDEENKKMIARLGMKKGMAKGMAEGITKGKTDVARKMLSRGMPPEEVSEITELPPDLIRSLMPDS